MSTIPKSSQLW